jgi:hypothetical protein
VHDRLLYRILALTAMASPAGCRGGSHRGMRSDPSLSSLATGATGASQASVSPDARDRYAKAAVIMAAFAERTGLTSQRPERRYLWTDAFAVCNYLGLAQATGQAEYSELALKLVDRVHHVLGKHRPDDRRTGWISGLDGQGEAHPTKGGLRIGKELPERRPDEPFDAQLEWDRDGQYFHYLTKWMHALDQATRATGQPFFNLWGRELAETAYRAFAYPVGSGGRQGMHWKMSIDLSYPLVPSMGQHDALDGYITCAQLRSTESRLRGGVGGPRLDDVAAGFDRMIDRDGLETTDPLGLGGLMADAYRLAQLAEQGAPVDLDLEDELLESALAGLEQYARQGDLEERAERRLAFRELGLAIGLHAVAAMRQKAVGGSRAHAMLQRFGAYDPLRSSIIAFWLEPEHQRARTWTEHRDINEVMLATALAPEGFLVLRAVGHEEP